MEDSQIFKIALAMSIVGLMGMLFSVNMISPREIKINEINRGMLDEDVSLVGVVQNVKKSSSSNTYFMELMDGTGKITVIVFESSAVDLEKVNMSVNSFKNRRVKVTGKISEYQGMMELILKDASSLDILA
ncbi:MAG TPA: OB-fold nucleic acid binding domain-containing protein [Methanobacterium sp.]|jgi:DNA/RNA endonuclease YhcR with UshA esterase domain|nr:MAG: DNA-binding protein [Methanobacterium sp.]HOI72153.1 OB-fold nucleic acid binding domain-containing protein [Methanobacterium sp.]